MNIDMDCVDISIIVPLYKGKKYLKKIINQIEVCNKKIDKTVELILINDFPEEKIIKIKNEKFTINIINNSENIGIHASRIKGLQSSKGKFIVFLDQDDYLRPDYLKSQIKKIGSADFCVCKLMNGNREHYTDSFRFEKVVTKEFMFNNWCSIVSPGQVLIKKQAIPSEWCNTIVKKNGADDYFLWLLMFASGKKISYNKEILFEHSINGFNTSRDTNLMMDSEEEIINKLLQTKYVDLEEKEQLHNLKISLRKIHIKQLDNISLAYFVQNFIREVSEEKIRKLFSGKIAIYGAGDIGKSIYTELKKYEDIDIIFIDRNAKFIHNEESVFLLEEAPEDLNSIIIAINGESISADIKKDLKSKFLCPSYTLRELLQRIDQVGNGKLFI